MQPINKNNQVEKSRTMYSVIILVISMLFLGTSCKKYIQIPPPDLGGVSGASVFTSDANAAAVLTGLYTRLSYGQGQGASGGIFSISLYCGLSSDEFTLFSGVAASDTKTSYYKNQLNASSVSVTPGTELWGSFYNNIFTCNSAIDGLNTATTLTPAVKQQLLGEAKFIRAFYYFYLVNLYGAIPLVTSSDYTQNPTLPNSSVAQIYQQIIADLKSAQALLSNNYLDATLLKTTTERVRPTQGAALALLARAYLYQPSPNWVGADSTATAVINNSNFSLTTLNKVFLKNSSEAIWQMQPVYPGHNTEDGWLFVLNTAPSTSKPVYLSPMLLNSFEASDQRKANWKHDTTYSSVTYSYPYKYQSATLNAAVTEYQMILRLAEQYLIRAEARAQEGNISGAQSDLNAIRNRAGLLNTTANDKPSLLAAIQHERQVELFTEWGDRWLDMKRSGTIDAIMNTTCPLKGGTWVSYQQLYPIPLGDVQKDLNLKQNVGY